MHEAVLTYEPGEGEDIDEQPLLSWACLCARRCTYREQYGIGGSDIVENERVLPLLFRA